MSDPYDLDTPPRIPDLRKENQDRESETNKKPALEPLTPPAPRASDLLRSHPNYPNNRVSSIATVVYERRATPADDFATAVFYIGLAIVVLALAYLLWGLWGGHLSIDYYQHTLTHNDRVRILSGIGLVETVLQVGLLIDAIILVFLYYDEEMVGYGLATAFLVLQFAVPYITGYVFTFTRSTPSPVVDDILGYLRTLSYIPAVPGAFLILFDIVRRGSEGLANARVRRATLPYGRGIAVHKPRNKFLGNCWDLPYCRDNIRKRCPVFLKKSRGPCWRNKRGCMCDESIVQLAINPNWRENLADPTAARMPIAMSKAEKNQRCRECVIYNTHEEQKYKALVGLVLAGCVALMAFFGDNMISIVGAVFDFVNAVVNRFAIVANPNLHQSVQSMPLYLDWLVLLTLLILVLSQVLQFVEYCCFRIKI